MLTLNPLFTQLASDEQITMTQTALNTQHSNDRREYG